MRERNVHLDALRAAGRGPVRRRLEALVNAGVLGVAGAQMVYRDAFGGRLVAVKDKRPSDLSDPSTPEDRIPYVCACGRIIYAPSCLCVIHCTECGEVGLGGASLAQQLPIADVRRQGVEQQNKSDPRERRDGWLLALAAIGALVLISVSIRLWVRQ